MSSVTIFQPDQFVLSTIYFSNLTFLRGKERKRSKSTKGSTKGSETLNLKNKLSKERIDLVEICNDEVIIV